jgi:hypothetical protein
MLTSCNPFAEADAQLGQTAKLPASWQPPAAGADAADAHLGPKFPHAACHAIGVIIQLRLVLKRDKFWRSVVQPARRHSRTAASPAPVRRDRVEHLTHQLQIRFRQLTRNIASASSTRSSNIRSAGKPCCRARAPKFNVACWWFPKSVPQLLQSFQPLRHRHDLRVRNRVRGAREQIGEADLRTDAACGSTRSVR